MLRGKTQGHQQALEPYSACLDCFRGVPGEMGVQNPFRVVRGQLGSTSSWGETIGALLGH